MKLILKDFQLDAVELLYDQVREACRRAANGKLEVVTLSAPTGSGKTVILTRLAELILQGDETHSPSPDSVFLWLTDQPELNVQTRDKMYATSDALSVSTLVEISGDFDYEIFPPGKVYFLNTQKLGTATNWVKTGDNRTFTLWDTIRNTIDAQPSRFFVVIDEAHRGTKLDKKKAAEANSIMQKFVLGGEEIPPAPMVIGLSATLDRFTQLLDAAAKAKKSRTHQRVDIDPADVIASGLLKRKVILHHPEKTLGAEYPLLREAVRSWLDIEQRWAAFCAAQHEPRIVHPILLIQVEDGSKKRISATDLDAVLNAVRDEAGTLPAPAFAHAFQEGSAITLPDGTAVRYLAPSAIDSDPDVKVVLFKTSLNTGWDCPRAEVMMSFRAGKDATLIAQLVGRMVRAPLARQIEQDEVLNSVSLLLPRYDAVHLESVIRHLTDAGGDVPPTTVELASERVILNQATGMRRCFEALKGLPTYIIPRRRSGTQVQRLGQLADALTHSGLRPGAGAEAREKLVDMLDREYARRKESAPYKALVKEDGTIPVNPVVLQYGTDKYETGEVRQVPVSDEMIAQLYEWARKRLGLDLGLRYWKRRADKDHSENHTITKLEFYALATDGQVVDTLEKTAASIVSSWLNEYKQRINKLDESERTRFDDVKGQVSKPTPDELDFTNRLTLDWSVPAGATQWRGHLYQDQNGFFPEKLNTWEVATLNEEMAQEDFVGWLRNKERQPWALCVPYEVAAVAKGCYPDFVVFRRKNGDIVADIVDPHLTSLDEAPAKAAALARFARDHQDQFGRIDLVVVDKPGGPGERVKRLRLMDEKTRTRVLGVTNQEHLRDLFEYEG